MATIPRSQGRDVSRPVMQQHTPITGLSAIGNAIGGALEARDNQQRENEVAAKRAELFHNQVSEQEAKVKLDDVLTREASEKVTLLKNDVSNGAMTADDASKNLQQWSDERYKQLESEMPMHARQTLQSHWSDNVNRNATGFLPLQLRADAQKGGVIAERALDVATRMEREAGLEYLKNNLQTLNISEADKQNRLSIYNTARDVLDIDERMTNAVSEKNMDGLQSILTDISENKFNYLDGPKLEQKRAQVMSRIESLNAQIQVEENKRVQVAGKVLNDFKSQVMTGRALDPEYMQTVLGAVQGTEHESEYQFYADQSNNFQKFANLQTSEMLKRINQQKTAQANSTTTDAVTEGKVLSVYESIYKDKLQKIKDDPNQAVSEVGLQVHSISHADKKGASLIVENAVNQLALKDDNLKIKPISTVDLPGIKKDFDAKGVDGKLDFIADLITQTKGVKNGSQIWGSALGQITGGDQAYTMAGIARMNGWKSTEGRDVATAIVAGKQALKNKQLIMPKQDLLKKEFNDYVGQTVSGQTANMTYSAFEAIYANVAETNGYQHKDGDDISKEIAKTALGLATGGVYEQGVKHGNQKQWKVSKPYAMDDARFEAHLQKGYATISDRTGMSVADLKDFRLIRSNTRSAKGELQYDLVNERGNPLVVNGAVWRINMIGVTK